MKTVKDRKILGESKEKRKYIKKEDRRFLQRNSLVVGFVVNS